MIKKTNERNLEFLQGKEQHYSEYFATINIRSGWGASLKTRSVSLSILRGGEIKGPGVAAPHGNYQCVAAPPGPESVRSPWNYPSLTESPNF